MIDSINTNNLMMESLGDEYFHFIINLEGEFISISSSVTKVLGFGEDDLEGTIYQWIDSEEDKKMLEERIRGSLCDADRETFSITVRNSRGMKRILEIKLISIGSRGDDNIHRQGIARDITDKKIVNDALYLVAQQGWAEKGEDYFKSLVYFIGETFSLDYIIIDKLLPDHKAVTVGLYSHGAVQPELIYDLDGTPCENVLQCSLCVYKSKIQETFPKDILLQQMNADSYLGIPLWDSKGEVIGLIAILDEKPLKDTSLLETVLQIVAVRTAHEMERMRDEKILRESERHLRTTLNSIGDGVITTDGSGIVSEINPVAEKLTGWSRNEALGLPVTDILHIHCGEKNCIVKVDEIIQDIIVGGQPVKQETEQFIKDKRGNKHRISNLWSPLKNREGEVFGVVVTFRNISKEYELQQKLIHTQKMDAIGQLAGGVAHDFNNMLAGIANCANLLKSPKRTIDEKGLHYADLILQVSKRAGDLTSKLLAFGRKSKQVSENIELHSIINEGVEILRRTIDKKVHISINKTAENHSVVGDSSGLLNCILNLCINASQAMPDGGVIDLATENHYFNSIYCKNSPFDIEPGNYCQISVKDNGCGIPPENLKKIFDPFFTTKDLGKGTGLGLAAVYGTICEHKGVIEVYSEPGNGTVFNIYLPCHTNEEEKSDARGQLISGYGTILVVDDEDFIRLTVSDMLEEIGYKVLTAENGMEAIDIFSEKYSEIDLVLLDMVMPKLNGLDTFKRMKEIDRECKTIMSSGFTKEKSSGELKDVGILGFIKKPYDYHSLSEMISRHL